MPMRDLKWMSEPNKRIARTRAYKNMAAALGIEPDECHVARFDEKLCRAALIYLAGETGGF